MMTPMIFVNLPVSDLDRSAGFYEAIGATRNRFCEEGTAIGLTLSDAIHIMLLTHEKFGQFTPRAIGGRDTVHALLCLSRESRAAVDRIVERAVAAGGVADHGPKQDYGFMYGRSFEDPDGHVWEAVWMDEAAAEAAHCNTENA